MNAHALLTSQGWRGTGHSLHPTSDGHGLKHHILIKRNDDGSGLGSKKDHKVEAWWLSAFDQALKSIDTQTGTMKGTLKGGALEKITAKTATTKYTGTRGLYTSFVRGGFIEGTIRRKDTSDTPTSSTTLLPAPPDSGVITPLAQDAGKTGKSKVETKEGRRARREARRRRKVRKEEEDTKARDRAAKKVEKKKARKAERNDKTKEESRARKDTRRKQKEKRRKRAASGD